MSNYINKNSGNKNFKGPTSVRDFNQGGGSSNGRSGMLSRSMLGSGSQDDGFVKLGGSKGQIMLTDQFNDRP